MTAIQPSDIPPSASSSLERLTIWCLLALNRLNPDSETIEEAGVTVRVAQIGIIIDDFGKPRLIGRASIELDPSYDSDATTKLWVKAQEVGTVSLPANYSVD